MLTAFFRIYAKKILIFINVIVTIVTIINVKFANTLVHLLITVMRRYLIDSLIYRHFINFHL